jgi:Holliday junction resolvase-like predicted endonuclease
MKLTDRSRIGDIAEFYAVTWLWDNGYEVYLNPGSTGFIDMIAYKDGQCILIDVKTLNTRRKNGHIGSCRTPQQVKHNVRFLGFHPKTRKLRWIEHKDVA